MTEHTSTSYSRHVIPAPTSADRRRVAEVVAALPGSVVVNLVDVSGQSVLFSKASLETMLAGRPSSITVDALDAARYLELVEAKVAQVSIGAAAVRGALRTRTVAQCAGEIQVLVQQLQSMILLVSVCALQRTGDAPSRAVRLLTVSANQLAVSAFELEDTVRCMDDLHYEWLPLLAKVVPLLRG